MTPTSRRGAAFVLLSIALLGCFLTFVGASRAAEVRGLPFIRAYSLEEIGKVPRSVRPGFDSYGRFAAMYDGVYAVLNDTTWVDRIAPTNADRTLMGTIRAVDGTYYYSGRASWGIVEQTPEGNFTAHPLVPADAPAWTTVTAFKEIMPTPTGICFYDLNGVVYWDYATRRNFFFELPRVVSCFGLGDGVFVSCEDRQLRLIDLHHKTIETISVPSLRDMIVERAVAMPDNRALLALQDGRLLVFDGTNAVPWPPQEQHDLHGRIMSMTRLVEGGVALSLAGKGLYIIAADGGLRWSLPPPDLTVPIALANNEPGVLWAIGENAIYKIFYDSPMTSFGRASGLNVIWPKVVIWNGKLYVACNRTVYEADAASPGAPSRFRPLKWLPEGEVAALATQGRHLIYAAGNELFASDSPGQSEFVTRLQNVDGIEFIAADVCVAVGSHEIAALRYRDGKWAECAPRIPGVGDAPIRTSVHDAVWIEMGSDKVARLIWRDGRITMEQIALPWSGGQWTNIGAIGSIIILSGGPGNRAYFDEKRGTLVEAPTIDALLSRSPYWIARVTEDERGVLWATHPSGVVTFTPKDGDYRVDATTYEMRNDSYPEVTVLPGNDVWLRPGRSLYHAEPRAQTLPQTPRPMLVSLFADEHNRELLTALGQPKKRLRLSYDDNSLSFAFFSGTYAWRFPPLYQYRLGAAERWRALDRSMVLRFPKLRDGDYQLEIRADGPRNPSSTPFRLEFSIDPPWYRTPLSYAVYGLLLLLAFVGGARWLNQRSLRRNAELELLVHERTKALEIAVEQLNEETRNAATLAERSRLAGEIHDSLQQGLSGSLLHLETTLENPALTPELRSKLHVMHNMLSYSREEVQQAVWNLASPLLQNSSLDQALRALAGYINSGSATINVVTPEQPVSLPGDVQHNLLRIAQEAITNAVKHAQAGHIGVSLQADDDTVVLSVTDDGRGFDVASSDGNGGHFGLRGIQSRARSIHAELQIASSPGAGTTIQVHVPRNSPSP